MNIFKKKESYELTYDLLIGQGLNKSFEVLRVYLDSKFTIDYCNTYLIEDDNLRLIDGNSIFDLEKIKTYSRDSIQIRFNKKGLEDSKERKIKARYVIPVQIRSDKFLLVLESLKYKTFDKREKDILKDVYKFKSLIEKNEE